MVIQIVKLRRWGAISFTLAMGVLYACSGEPSHTGTKSVSSVSVSSFTGDFGVMKSLTRLTAAGTGKVAAILPDTVSARYVQFDQPDLTRAFEDAGLPASDLVVQNALGSDADELADARTDITDGAKVLILDPVDSTVGDLIESYAASHQVKVIDYDELTLGGSRTYYVSFNNVEAGKLLGKGFVDCADTWDVKKPQVILVRGAATDNNANLQYAGLSNVLEPYFRSGQYVDLANTFESSNPALTLSYFETTYAQHPDTNSAVFVSDETASAIISFLRSHGVKARTFPTTGEGATVSGLDNVLDGYQCGTVYEPAYLEPEAAAAVALYLRAGRTPVSTLVNGTTTDPKANVPVPSVLLDPEWVTASNMESTVVRDGFVQASQICAGSNSVLCKEHGIQ